MKKLLLVPSLAALAVAANAADPSKIPEKIARQKKNCCSRTISRKLRRPKRWHKVVPTFAFEKGMLKGTQTRDKNIPAADGKPAVTAYAAVHGLEIPTQDSSC